MYPLVFCCFITIPCGRRLILFACVALFLFKLLLLCPLPAITGHRPTPKTSQRAWPKPQFSNCFKRVCLLLLSFPCFVGVRYRFYFCLCMCFCCLVRLCCCPLLFLFDPSVLFYLLFMVFNFVALFPFFFVFDVYIICVALLFRSRKRKKKTAHTRNLPTQSACELSCFSSLYVYVYITYTYTLRIRYICIRSVYVARYTLYI